MLARVSGTGFWAGGAHRRSYTIDEAPWCLFVLEFDDPCVKNRCESHGVGSLARPKCVVQTTYSCSNDDDHNDTVNMSLVLV
jgi:hypothetical protein